MSLLRFEQDAVVVQISNCPTTNLIRKVTAYAFLWDTNEKTIKIPCLVQYYDGEELALLPGYHVVLRASNEYYVNAQGQVIGTVESFADEAPEGDYMLEYEFWCQMFYSGAIDGPELMAQAVTDADQGIYKRFNLAA